jgi:serine phosphatase RsbU (regulator of sigma subunit)/ABC-type amino acid transport substrate-binding protein
MNKLLFLTFTFILVAFNCLPQDSWQDVLKHKEGVLILNYSNSDVFISDKSGELIGIEYDIMNEFVKFVSDKYQVNLSITPKKHSGFNEIYNCIKASASGNFGASSFSITKNRLREVNFSPKYMNDVETMISSYNLPVFKDTIEFLNFIDKVSFLVIPNTTYEEDFDSLNKMGYNLKALKIDEGTEVLLDYYLDDNYVGFAELPTYFMAKKKGMKLKRQNLFKYKRLGYGLIFPLNSDWKPIVDEFFNDAESKVKMNKIIQKHLGDDINELILNLSGDDKDEFLLLTKEKELQEVEIELNELTILNSELEKEKIVAENLLKEEKSYIEKVILYSGLLFLSLILVFSLVMIRNKIKANTIIELQKKRVENHKDIIEEQHQELSKTHKDISASIKYAERLQLAILPSRQNLDDGLGDGFVLFKPKDVVSGDFYWLHEMEGVKILTVAECTGHGVPGALVSVVCNEALNRCVKEFNLKEPKDILDKSRELIIKTFAKSGKGIQDGMDICMISIKKDVLHYAGAYNPLWIVRHVDNLTDSQKNEKGTVIINELGLIELKACKQPVGLYENEKPFIQTKLQLFKNDKLYLFTDGFADQFGGERNKKFKSKPFKKLLLNNSLLPMNEQQVILNETFDAWKGNEEQVDDVCIIGLAPIV